MATKIKITGLEALAIRKKLSLNQSDFWNQFGVTQSGGSRYESGRNIPRPVQILLAAKYGKAAAKREALAVVGVEAGPDDNKGAKLLAIVRAFVEKQRISFPEVIHQTDRVIENAYGLIQDLVDVAGYLPEEDE